MFGNQRKRGFRQGRDADQRHFLQVGSVIAGGLQSILGKLRGNVFGGDVAAALARAAAFQQIMREIANVPANVFGIDGLHRGKGSARQPHRDTARLATVGLDARRRTSSAHSRETQHSRSGRQRNCFPRLLRIDSLSPDKHCARRVPCGMLQLVRDCKEIVTEQRSICKSGSRIADTDRSVTRAALCRAIGESVDRKLCLSVARDRRDQFFDPQPARKSRTSSPGLNSTAGTDFPASAILRLISVKSAFTQPTLEISISPSCAIQNMVGTLVSP